MRDIARVVERIRQNRAALAARPTFNRGAPPPVLVGLDGSVAPGALVFDTVTGLEGEVLYGTRENLVVSAPTR